VRREQHRAGDDQRVLIFLADLLPVRNIGEEAFVRLQILLVFDLFGQRQDLTRALVGRFRIARLAVGGRLWMSASMTLSDDLVRS
jgi:hypothetical protein